MNSDEPVFPKIMTNRDSEYGAVHSDVHSSGGLTKREYFAAMAMQGLLTGITGNRSAVQYIEDLAKNNSVLKETVVARISLDYADALIAELSKLTP